MARIHALFTIALLVVQALSAPVSKQNVGERKATNKEAANLEDELHKQAGEGKKDTPETSEPSPGHKPRGALGQLMEAAAEAEASAEQQGDKTEDDASLQSVIYSIYNNPEVLKALLRAGETRDRQKEVEGKTLNGIKRQEEHDEANDDDTGLIQDDKASNIMKKDGDELYPPASASKKMNEEYLALRQGNENPIQHHKYDKSKDMENEIPEPDDDDDGDVPPEEYEFDDYPREFDDDGEDDDDEDDEVMEELANAEAEEQDNETPEDPDQDFQNVWHKNRVNPTSKV